MSGNRLSLLTRFIAVLCMAQVFVLSLQANLASTEQARHSVGAVHTPTALSGAILEHFGADGDHAAYHHSHGAGHHQDADHAQQTGHHHIGDGASTPWVGADAAGITHAPAASVSLPRHYPSPRVAFTKGLERPPRA